MLRWLVAALSVVSFAAAPAAVADPEDLVPECTGGQEAEPGECTPAPGDFSAEASHPLFGLFPGANPNLPLGPTPLNFPVVIPLGVTPFNVPVNLPLGPTPPAQSPFAQR